MPNTWRSKQEQKVDEQAGYGDYLSAIQNTLVDFGELEDGQFVNRKIRVTVCGKSIWSYPSAQGMARGGWLHYSIIAKGSRLFDAIELCRNWDEFWELNVLSIFDYFPNKSFKDWTGDETRKQFLELGFIPYVLVDGGDKRSTARKQCKNFVAANIKRNDPVSRRFIQYLCMQRSHVTMMVRDAKSGSVLVKPESEYIWLDRHKAGYDCFGDPEWDDGLSVNEELLTTFSTRRVREWQFGFTDYYEVICWDVVPNRSFSTLHATILDALLKANRVCSGADNFPLCD